MMSKEKDKHVRTKERGQLSTSVRQNISHSFPKTRTKTGCFTCRKRKKKCDEHYPICSGCARNFLSCVWPKNKCDTLPKNFKITSGTAAHIKASKSSANTETRNRGIAKSSFFVNKHLSNLCDIEPTYSDFDVPSSMCSVIPLKLYKHESSRSFTKECTKSGKIPGVMSFKISLANASHKHMNKLEQTIPPRVLFIDSLTSRSGYSCGRVTTDNHLTRADIHKTVDQQSIDQMFTSLYDTLQSKKLPWNLSEYPYLESDDTSIYNNFMDSFIPKVLSQGYYTVNSPKISFLREVFYAYSSLCLMKMVSSLSMENPRDHFTIADAHYNKAIESIKNCYEPSDVGKKVEQQGNAPAFECGWMLLCISIIRITTKNIDLVSKETMDNSFQTNSCNGSITVEETERILLVNFLFSYAIGLYFLPDNDLRSIPSPFKIFDKYRVQFSSALFGSENNQRSSKMWLFNVIQGSIFNCYENLCKLFWVLRHLEELDPQKKTNYLSTVKHDMTLIWTTLQTSDIQLDSSSDKRTSTFLVFAKYLHQSLEILHMKLMDPELGPSNPVIKFYVNQFVHIYRSLTNDAEVPKCLKLMPLFICGCASKSLDDRVFLTKELYFLGRDLSLQIISTITARLEDRWRIEETGGKSSLTSLIARCGFDICK